MIMINMSLINFITNLGLLFTFQPLFFMMISLGVLAFYAIQRAAQAGWSIVLYRIMEGITSYLLPGCIFVLIILGFLCS